MSRLRYSWTARVVLIAIRRDPRCRASDRVEAVAVMVAFAAMVASIPLAVLLGTTVFRHSLVTVHRQAVERHRVVATVLSTSVEDAASPYGAASRARIEWRAPGGRIVRGSLYVRGLPSVGGHLDVWTTSDGRLVEAPLTRARAEVGAYVAGVASLVGQVMAIWLVLLAVRWLLMRLRIRAWDAEWVEVATRSRS